MIEMLGVLAIIAVLSVGGIASYSKVMQKRLAKNSSGITLPAKIQNALAIFLLMTLIIFTNYVNPATAL